MLGKAFPRLVLLKLASSGGGERVNESPENGGLAGNGPVEKARPLKSQVSLRKQAGFALCSTIRISVSNYKCNIHMPMAGSCSRLGSLASRLLEGLGRPVSLCPHAWKFVRISTPPTPTRARHGVSGVSFSSGV